MCVLIPSLHKENTGSLITLIQVYNTEVRPEFPLMSDLLYENPYSGQLWMVFNVNKQYMFAGDAYSRHYASKLDKGDYILRMQVYTF